MSNVNIRKITIDDKEEFLKMSKEFYSSDAVLSDIKPQYHENAFNELMRSNDYLECYIFDSGSEILGYGLINKMFTHETGGLTVWIEELYLRENSRGKGIGGRFLDMVEKLYPANRIRLETEPENERAAALYYRHGYKKLDYMQMYKDL